MDRYYIYSIDRKGCHIKRKATLKSFSTFEEAKLYARGLAERLAALNNEKVEMLAYNPNFLDKSGYGEVIIAKMSSYFILIQR